MTFEYNATTIEVQTWFIPIDILNIILCSLAVLLSSLFLYVILSDKIYTTVSMMLIANSCLAEFCFSTDLLIMAIVTIYNDARTIYYSDSFCLLLGYISYVTVGIQNYSYLLQAIYRYILIVYPSRIFWQSTKFQAFLISLTWICGIVYPIAFLFTNHIKYEVDDQKCQMPLQLSFLTIFNAIYIYTLPMLSIILIYLKLVRYVQEMSRLVTPANRLFHAKRELTIIRRIVSLVFIVVALGLPYAIFIVMSFFNSAPKYHFRIAYFFIHISLILILIALLKITEPLKASLLKIIRRRPVHVVPTVA